MHQYNFALIPQASVKDRPTQLFRKSTIEITMHACHCNILVLMFVWQCFIAFFVWSINCNSTKWWDHERNRWRIRHDEVTCEHRAPEAEPASSFSSIFNSALLFQILPMMTEHELLAPDAEPIHVQEQNQDENDEREYLCPVSATSVSFWFLNVWNLHTILMDEFCCRLSLLGTWRSPSFPTSAYARHLSLYIPSVT